MKPVKRAKARIALGKIYYTYNRYLEWYFGNTKFARKIEIDVLPYTAFKHETPLLRQLKDVDMWLQYNKIVNLRIAVERLNGIIIYPGETFSYWRLIGKPTRKKGYIDGMMLSNGTYKTGIGGGLCQLSNLIYWLALHTPLKVTERHRHSYDVFPGSNRTQPFGSGATCFYNYLDLRIYNPTEQPYQLNIYLTDDYLVGQWNTVEKSLYSYEVYEKEHRITQEYWGGYVRHNLIYRRVFNCNGELINDEYVVENYAIMMYQPLLESGHAI
ncbi:VanW family protein [Proteiniborus sp. MB09-C3]|uniref:VanW family protein n=1 Tax=Proteiniborus sp. MB09-C3 TaxID=3050072 RepID=UPI0025524DE5|nr:VanW family protein [Proteiniborus sp. MB09-C3]WIV12764.1 VanW family protein [Proteiniborus sp. MB09-C3]